MAEVVGPVEFQRGLEERVGRELATRADQMRAYGEITGLRGDLLEEEFAIASGEVKAGTTVLGKDGEHDDPIQANLDIKVEARE